MNQIQDNTERLDELEARVDRLEGGSDVDDAPPGDREDTGGGGAGGPEAVRERVLDELGDGPPRKSAAREAVADAVALLVEDGPLETGELQDELYPAYEEHYATKRTMWNSLDRHLEKVDGVEKPGYGEWDAE